MSLSPPDNFVDMVWVMGVATAFTVIAAALIIGLLGACS